MMAGGSAPASVDVVVVVVNVDVVVVAVVVLSAVVPVPAAPLLLPRRRFRHPPFLLKPRPSSCVL